MAAEAEGARHAEPSTGAILAVNSGSSSLKAGLYRSKGGDEALVLTASAANIARPGGSLEIRDESGKTQHKEMRDFASASEAMCAIAQALGRMARTQPSSVGHRIVHGGPRLREHQRITPELLHTLEESVHFAPLHIPPALDLIHQTEALYPGLPQAACFDTAFHRTLPELASHFALPAELWDAGILRYGFHGLSYEAIVSILGQELRPRAVIAHLGNGSSLAALRDGVSVDTSMGLTPTGGIPMSTRSGDLDPGILLYLLRAHGMNGSQLEALLNRQSGLAGLSGGQSDLRGLQSAAQAGDPKAAFAIELFARSIAKTIGSYAAVLGGIDQLIFTGGIGENSAMVRALAVKDLGFLGMDLDEQANLESRSVISKPGSLCQLRVIPADEDRQIARHTRRLLRGKS